VEKHYVIGQEHDGPSSAPAAKPSPVSCGSTSSPKDEDLSKISWDDFFEKFEKEKLAFLSTRRRPPTEPRADFTNSFGATTVDAREIVAGGMLLVMSRGSTMRAGATIGRVPLRCERRSQPRRQRMLIAAAAEQGQATNPVRVARHSR